MSSMTTVYMQAHSSGVSRPYMQWMNNDDGGLYGTTVNWAHVSGSEGQETYELHVRNIGGAGDQAEENTLS